MLTSPKVAGHAAVVTQQPNAFARAFGARRIRSREHVPVPRITDELSRASEPSVSAPPRCFHPPFGDPVSEKTWNTNTQRPRRPSRTEFRLARIREIKAKNAFFDRLSVIGVWTRLVLVGALAVSLFWWPYGRDCGFGFAAFLGSNAMAIVGGISLAARTWRDRMPWPFAGGLLFVALAWTVIALHTLPRIRYPLSGATVAGLYCPSSR